MNEDEKQLLQKLATSVYGENGIEAQIKSLHLAVFGDGNGNKGMLQMFQELMGYMKAGILLGKASKWLVGIVISLLTIFGLIKTLWK